MIPSPKHRGAIYASAAIAFLLTASCARESTLPRETQTVDGMAIYLGVIPAPVVKGHSVSAGDPNAMHGGASSNGNSHHLIVALFDSKSGARIAAARVKAVIADRHDKQLTEFALEPMQIAGTTTFGNFVDLPNEGLWRIRLAIEREGIAQPSKAVFGYEFRSHQY